jgi:hypothetical protein
VHFLFDASLASLAGRKGLIEFATLDEAVGTCNAIVRIICRFVFHVEFFRVDFVWFPEYHTPVENGSVLGLDHGRK